MAAKGVFFGNVHETEPPGIVEADGDAAIGLEDNVVVAFQRRRRAVEYPEPSRHTQVGNQRRPVFKPEQEEFAAPAEGGHGPALKPARKAPGQGKPKIGPERLDGGQAPAFENAGQAPAHGFDLGKLGHRSGT